MDNKQTIDKIRQSLNQHRHHLSQKITNEKQYRTDAVGTIYHVGETLGNDYETTKPHAPHQEDDLFAADQLRRQQQKSKVLEQRLKNKDVFVNQLKDFQSELTQAFDNSQAQLHALQLKYQALLVDNERLKEENEELRRLIIHMEKVHQKTPERPPLKKTAQQRSYSQKHLASTTPIYPPQLINLAQGINTSVDEVSAEARRIGKFINNIWEMVATCTHTQNCQSLKDKLKFSWRWLKATVKDSMKKDMPQFTTRRDEDGQLERMTTQNKYYLHLIRLTMDYFKLPESQTAKQLQIILRQRLYRK